MFSQAWFMYDFIICVNCLVLTFNNSILLVDIKSILCCTRIVCDKWFCAFSPGTYNLFKHNCNSFTEEVSNFLVGSGIPKYILDLPEEILQTYVSLIAIFNID